MKLKKIKDNGFDCWTDEMIEGFAEAKFKPNDIVDTNDNLYGCITDDIEYDKDKKSFKYYVSFIVDGGYYYEYQLKPHKSNKEQMKETNNVCANAIAGNIIAEKDMLSIALSNGLILPKCANKDLVKMDIGDVSDGYHTFNELYDYRALYNAAFFNSLAVYVENMGNWVVDYDVHKSKKHSDGEDCFGGGWFVVMAELPTGQISNHYPMKDWDLFNIPEKEKANKWDGHTPQDVAKRMREFLTPKPKYPKTYEECCKVLNIQSDWHLTFELNNSTSCDLCVNNEFDYVCRLEAFRKLLICRDAYWKITGEEMGLGKPWEPDWDTNENELFVIANYNGTIVKTGWYYVYTKTLVFPTEEMRNAFYENFKELIEQCKELL